MINTSIEVSKLPKVIELSENLEMAHGTLTDGFADSQMFSEHNLASKWHQCEQCQNMVLIEYKSKHNRCCKLYSNFIKKGQFDYLCSLCLEELQRRGSIFNHMIKRHSDKHQSIEKEISQNTSTEAAELPKVIELSDSPPKSPTEIQIVKAKPMKKWKN